MRCLCNSQFGRIKGFWSVLHVLLSPSKVSRATVRLRGPTHSSNWASATSSWCGLYGAPVSPPSCPTHPNPPRGCGRSAASHHPPARLWVKGVRMLGMSCVRTPRGQGRPLRLFHCVQKSPETQWPTIGCHCLRCCWVFGYPLPLRSRERLLEPS